MQKQEIIDRKFSRAFQGYDVAEVDFFLDELYREFSLMEHEIEDLRARVDTLEERRRREDSASSAYDRPLLIEASETPAFEEGGEEAFAQGDLPAEEETAFLITDTEE